MKTCIGCKYAEWDKTKAGRLHPSGDGRCKYKIVMPVIPAAFSWLGLGNPPHPLGGHISRRKELRDHCPCFVHADG